MAEELGPRFSHGQDGGMTFLNRKIVDRFTEARAIASNNDIRCSDKDVHDLRRIVKETVSYMIAILIQSLIDSMLGESSFQSSFFSTAVTFTENLHLSRVQRTTAMIKKSLSN
jgi:hypothetical protein